MFPVRVTTDRDTLSTEPLAKRGDSIYLFIHSFIYVGRSPQKAALLHTYIHTGKRKVTVHGAPRCPESSKQCNF
jgi:hypothetical protein